MNYLIKDIENFQIEYPDHTTQEFLTLDEYHNAARRIISYFGPKYTSKDKVKMMLNSEDYISEVAMQLMMGDWRWQNEREKKKNRYAYRNQCGIWAILDCLGIKHTSKNVDHSSLDATLDETSFVNLIEDIKADPPINVVCQHERLERIKKKISFLMKHTRLTKSQRQCIVMRYFDGLESYEEIGNSLEPKITRQAVQQNIQRGIIKLKRTARGIKNGHTKTI